MPINKSVQMMASMQNALTRGYPNAEVSREGNRITITETTEETEYNTESAAEWVNPYVKLNPKTNRYKQVKGYYREVKKPISITGRGDRLSGSSEEQVAAVALGIKNKEYERD